ncbi:multicopper oxidase domain-containing protein [Acinetobacter towneri]|uniref:Multicopper oxidase domain-containing protein n=1 Tax=Acinetobacter towneri TaxID=202956 RepID=A0AB35M1X7_9GAMM|nr:multicopper oxidase domain-containing protein [Acinetobacter towneri]MDM1719566.1 multicopper oxidase domain-containing protein [Acinetobacter towneri]MDM1731669.1 multicopper oxidase domain-containing protein [Acinetobacter towneri]MDM1734294.1 multicopper oxidase domain-containing protein [Acinetobacter towneri]MDM1739638.1 multicopper oxidase domain-containing protein [Acinetobacter towneri]MDM1742330.1 multicopper oxidase domain-containing protein [Acinetobacter towneri]
MSKFYQPALFLTVCALCSSSAFAAVKEYHLTIAEQTVNITGKSVQRITVNGQFPAPALEFEEGDEAVIHVNNQLKNQDSSIHWHGLLLPGLMDGVPGFNGFQGIKPQGHFVYQFKVRQSGTYWYHAHSKGQEQDGLYGSLVIHPKAKPAVNAHEYTDRDYVVMLSDFHEKSSNQIQKDLKISAEFYQNQRETLGDVWRQVQRDGLKATWSDRKMWNQMRMLKTDLSDVTGYTFLMNGKTPEQNWTGVFKPNEKVRLRFINASAMSFYDVRIPNLKMTVVSADGQPVKPVTVDEFRIGTAETYDVIVEPQAAHYQIEAESIDRSGFAVGSLQSELHSATSNLQLPAARPRALLTMQDMGHATEHSGDDHSKMNHATMSEMDHSKMNHAAMSEMDHSKMNHAAMSEMDHSKMNHAAMSEMDHSKMNHVAMSEMDHSKMNHATMSENTHTQHGMPSTEHKNAVVYGWANASTPAGHKALHYEDLKSLQPQADTREPSSELVVRLGGTMERYIWTINGKKFSDATPLKVKYGERIRIKFINDSMMAHPMHLHGMFMQLENGQTAAEMPNKHTLIVPPGQTVTALLTADELGEWAIHCHLLYHMSAGMMNKLIVAQVSENEPLSTTAIQATQTPSATAQKGAAHAQH